MGTATKALSRQQWSRYAGLAAGAAAVAVVGAAVGAGLTAIATRAGDASPAVLVALVLVPAFIVAVIADPRIGVVAVFATFPLGATGVPTGFVTLQIVEVAVLVVAAIVGLRRLGLGQTLLPWSGAMAAAVALVGWCVLTLPSGIDQELGVKQVAALAGGLIFTMTVVAACRDMEDVRKIMTGLTVVAVMMSITAILSGGQFQSEFGGTVVQGRLQGAFDQPNQLGAFGALTTIVAAGLLLGSRSLRGRLAAAGAMALTLVALLLSLSRGGWIGAAFAVLFLVFALQEVRRALLAFSVPLLGLAVAIGSFAPTAPQIEVVGQRVRNITELSPYDDRPAIWKEARRQIGADPWTGQGPGSFPAASTRAASDANTVFAHHAHSIVLTWAAETGIPGAVLVVVFAVSLAVAGRAVSQSLVRRRRRRDRALVAGISAALIAMAGQGLVDYTLRNAVINFAIFGVIGMLLATYRLVVVEEREADDSADAGVSPADEGRLRPSLDGAS